MNESIKDRFLKEHELSMDDLDKVNGGVDYGLGCGLCPVCGAPMTCIRDDNGLYCDIACLNGDYSNDQGLTEKELRAFISSTYTKWG